MKKRIALIAALCVGVYALALVVLYFTGCVEIRSSSGYGKCISVAFFEKQKLAGVDKIVISNRIGLEKHSLVITDEEIVQRVLEETTIADRADIVCNDDMQIDLYIGDKMVRSMTWGTCCHVIRLYREDALHWLFARGGGGEGCVYMSRDLADMLVALWNQQYPEFPIPR